MADTSPPLLQQNTYCSDIPHLLEARDGRVNLRSSLEASNPSTSTLAQPEMRHVSQEQHSGTETFIIFSRPLSRMFSSLTGVAENCVNFVADSHIAFDKVHHVSVMATIMHISLHELAHFLPQAQPNLMYHWFVPLFASAAFLSGIIMLWMKCYPSQPVVVCAITTLFAVECLVPFAIAGCTILCIGNVVSLTDLIFFCGGLLGLCSLASWGIRQVMYPSLGLG